MIVAARDVYGDPLDASHRITMSRAGGGSGPPSTADVPPGGDADFLTDVTKTYRLKISAVRYRSVSRYVQGSVDQVDLMLPIDPVAVVGFEWPDETDDIPGVDFEALPDKRRATLLNIWAKLWMTVVGVAPAATFVKEVREVRADRLIVVVDPELIELLDDAEDFGDADSSLHHPPAGYSNGPSVKGPEQAGAIQFSFFLPGDVNAPTLADIDIDEAKGFPHIIDVIRHYLTGSETDPTDVQQILVGHQNIDPGWRPVVALTA